MNKTKIIPKSVWRVWYVIIALCLVAGGSPTWAQQLSDLTLEQQQMLKQLPAAQRRELLERFGQSTTIAPRAVRTPVNTGAGLMQIPIEPEEEPELPIFSAGDTLIVTTTVEAAFSTNQDVSSLSTSIIEGNPYLIDRDGKLRLPRVEGIPLVGLTEAQAKIRLDAEPALIGITATIVRLPVEDLTSKKLEPFGYDLFRKRDRMVPSEQNTPVPIDYVVGPGDTVRIQLFGTQNSQYELDIDRDGTLNFPDLGPVNVAGLSFDRMRQDIERRVSEQLIGTQVSVTLGQLRSVQVVLVGDVEAPGTYLISALASMTDVLFLAGGIAENGSLRNVQLKRKGRTITTLDLYELLLSGDSTHNRRVNNGDVIFVPPVGPRITISGSVKRPALYEFKSRLSAGDALTLAGGAEPSAYLAGATIERSVPATGLTVVDVDLTASGGRSVAVTDGDVLIVPGNTAQIDSAVTLIGHVFRPGLLQWSPGLRLGDVLRSSRDLMPQADLNYVLVKREAFPNGPVEVFSADVAAIWAHAPGASNPVLEVRDSIYVFSKTEGRQPYLKQILAQLRIRGTAGEPSPIVRVGGRVKDPGEYPLEANMTVADLVRASGGLDESAYQHVAELTRYRIAGGESRETELIDVALGDALAGVAGADIELVSFDHLIVKEISRWQQDDLVEIRGEVLFPGRYPIYRGEPLTSVLARAGGLTEHSFPAGSVFTRQTLKDREKDQLEVLASRVEGDLTTLALSDPGQIEAISIGQSLLSQLKSTQPSGRLVIDLGVIAAGSSQHDILMRGGDLLIIPPMTQEVTVLGEVQYATSHLWDPNLDRNDYIARSGGITVKADARRIYIVRANGEVVVGNRSRFFSKSRGFDINPGDTIVVPLDTDRVKPLVLWTSVTQILYNLAIAAAAVRSF